MKVTLFRVYIAIYAIALLVCGAVAHKPAVTTVSHHSTPTEGLYGPTGRVLTCTGSVGNTVCTYVENGVTKTWTIDPPQVPGTYWQHRKTPDSYSAPQASNPICTRTDSAVTDPEYGYINNAQGVPVPGGYSCNQPGAVCTWGGFGYPHYTAGYHAIGQ